MRDQYATSAIQPERAITLNERLNKACVSLQYQCERLESVLSRVNGTPQKIEGAKVGTAPTPTLPLQATVEHLEEVQGRLATLADGVERIA